MPVSDRHKRYDQTKTRIMRACVKGEDAVKELGTKVLPKPSGIRLAEISGDDTEKKQAAEDWKSYKFRAEYYDLVGPTQDGLVGLAFKNPWVFDMPDRLKTFMDEMATPDGKTLDELAEKIVRERTVTPRVGLFSDMVEGRPYILTYESESIINGRGSPASMIVLEEKTEVPAKDRFRCDVETSYRELFMDGNRYRVINHIPTSESAVFNEIENAQGLQEGAIPFVFIGAQNLDSEDNTFIPLWPLAKKLLKAYEISPDYYQAMHYTAQPILFLRGFGDDVPSVAGATTTIGSDTVNADAKYVEFEGKGVGAMLEAIERQIREAMLFTHYLQDKGSGVESGEALGIRVGSQTATLRSVITTTAAALEQSLKYCAQWISADPDQVKVTPNLEFTDADIDSAILKVLGDQVALGVIPTEVYQAYQRQIKLTDLIDEDIAKLLEEQREREAAETIGMGEPVEGDAFGDVASV